MEMYALSYASVRQVKGRRIQPSRNGKKNGKKEMAGNEDEWFPMILESEKQLGLSVRYTVQ
jgi:hypothetical protein